MEILNPFDTSIKKAIEEIDPLWPKYDGLLIAGTHAPADIEKQIWKLHEARLAGLPTLGICFGHQLMAIEYARYVLGHISATSEEFGEDGENVVYKLPQLNVGLHKGESWWNNYAVLPGLEERMVKELYKPSYFGVQYHPEYQSSKSSPHPVLVTFLNEAKRFTEK